MKEDVSCKLLHSVVMIYYPNGMFDLCGMASGYFKVPLIVLIIESLEKDKTYAVSRLEGKFKKLNSLNETNIKYN